MPQTVFLTIAGTIFASDTTAVALFAAAEEVVGDVYLKVWQRASQYQAERGHAIS